MDIIDKFLNFEEKYKLIEKEINGFCIWGYIRFNIYKILAGQQSYNSGAGKKKKIWMLVKAIYRYPIKIKEKKILVFNHPRKMKINGCYECIYTDEISKLYKNDTNVFEFLYKGKHFIPSKIDNITFLDYVDIFPVIERLLFGRFHKKTVNQLRSSASYLYDLLKREFQTDIKKDYLEKMIIKRYYWHYYKKKHLKRIVERANPKVILEVVGYETNKMIVNEIAKELKIPTIEVQHGVIGRGHIAYNYLEKQKLPYFPDKIFLYSQYWKSCTLFPINADNQVITGFNYIERELKKVTEKVEGAYNILFISQNDDQAKRLSRLAVELYKLFKNKKIECKLFYKLHPLETDTWKNNYPELAKYTKYNDEISVIDNSTIPIYEYFSKCNIQIGITSTAIYEGLAFGLRTYIYKTEMSKIYMSYLIDTKYAVFFTNSVDLFRKIRTINKNKSVNLDFIWEKNSLKNISREIDKYL